MKDLQFNTHITPEEWERLHDTPIEDMGFSVRAYTTLKRAEFNTLGDIADATLEEMEQLMLPKLKGLEEEKRISCFQRIIEEIDKLGITHPTMEEKQNILESLTETEALKRELRLLEYKYERIECRNRMLEEELHNQMKHTQNSIRNAIKEARNIVDKGELPVAQIIERMVFAQNGRKTVGFCKIFELYEGECQLEIDSMNRKPINMSCEVCIDRFLAEYYRKRRYGKSAADCGRFRN